MPTRWVERLRLVGLQRQDASANDGTSNTANVQVSAVRSANGQITANGIRKREVEEAESFRRRKTSRKLDTDTEMYLEG